MKVLWHLLGEASINKTTRDEVVAKCSGPVNGKTKPKKELRQVMLNHSKKGTVFSRYELGEVNRVFNLWKFVEALVKMGDHFKNDSGDIPTPLSDELKDLIGVCCMDEQLVDLLDKAKDSPGSFNVAITEHGFRLPGDVETFRTLFGVGTIQGDFKAVDFLGWKRPETAGKVARACNSSVTFSENYDHRDPTL